MSHNSTWKSLRTLQPSITQNNSWGINFLGWYSEPDTHTPNLVMGVPGMQRSGLSRKEVVVSQCLLIRKVALDS